MLKLNIPIPERCSQCPCFSDTVYGKCQVNDHWLDASDGAWFSDHRPLWCPILEEDTGRKHPTPQEDGKIFRNRDGEVVGVQVDISEI